MTVSTQRASNGGMNTHLIMRAIHESAPVSRAELSERLGLAPSTVSVLTGKLQEQKYIRECGNASSGGGRPPVLLEINPDGGYFISVDLRGTKMSIGILDLSLNILYDWSYLIPLEGGEHLYTQLVKAISDIRDFCKEKQFSVLGIGVASPGLIEPLTGLVIEADHFNWNHFNLRERLQEEFGCTVVVENDANAAAYGEFLFGPGREGNVNNMIYISTGPGIGAGLILNGELYSGPTGVAGEIGHVTVEENGKKCFCGKTGCLTTIASIPWMVREYERHKGTQSDLQIDPLKLIKFAEMGDEVARRIVFDAGRAVGIAAGNQVNVLNLDGVIFGGFVFEGGGLMYEAAKEGLKQAVLPKLWDDLRVHLSAYGSTAGMIGVIACGMGNIFSY